MSLSDFPILYHKPLYKSNVLVKVERGRIKKMLENEKLCKHTTFGIGGKAKYFWMVRSEKDFLEGLEFSRKEKIPFFVLGGGSNILVSDKGFNGLVIKNENAGIKKLGKDFLEVGSGTNLGSLVEFATEQNLFGLEGLFGIPGTVGGAIVGNAGVKESFIGDILESVRVLTNRGEIFEIDQKDADFSYRSSRFQKTGEIILSAKIKLEKSDKSEIERRIKKTISMRQNQPKGKSAGCIFKNPKKGFAGYYLDRAGLKGTQIGGAKVSEKHANFIINVGGAKASDVLQLIHLCKEKVREKFGVSLEEEIVLLGEF